MMHCCICSLSLHARSLSIQLKLSTSIWGRCSLMPLETPINLEYSRAGLEPIPTPSLRRTMRRTGSVHVATLRYCRMKNARSLCVISDQLCAPLSIRPAIAPPRGRAEAAIVRATAPLCAPRGEQWRTVSDRNRLVHHRTKPAPRPRRARRATPSRQLTGQPEPEPGPAGGGGWR